MDTVDLRARRQLRLARMDNRLGESLCFILGVGVPTPSTTRGANESVITNAIVMAERQQPGARVRTFTGKFDHREPSKFGRLARAGDTVRAGHTAPTSSASRAQRDSTPTDRPQSLKVPSHACTTRPRGPTTRLRPGSTVLPSRASPHEILSASGAST